MHHKYLKIIGFFLATLIVIFLAVVYLKPDKYKNISSLNQLDEFDFLNGTQIDTMILKKSYDDARWIVINDKEMIEEMVGYLNELIIVFDHYKSMKNTVGGGDCVTVFRIGEEEHSISYLRKCNQIVIHGYYYNIQSDKSDNPFLKLYNEGLEKYGITNPWK
jgi:hypothetical protein